MNFLTVSLLKEKGYNPLSYRYMVLNSHYQRNLEFSFESLDGAENAYLKLKNKINSLSGKEDKIDEDSFNKYDLEFKEAIGSNLNTASALTVLYDVLKSDTNDFTKLKLIENFDKVLSLDLLKNDTDDISSEIMKLVELRNKYKSEKNYQEADKVRDEILNLGYKILDTREGVKIERI